MPWRPKVPSPTWRSFLQNHLTDIVAIDMFVVATATFRLLYALIVLGHDRRRVMHFNVTQYPTQAWLSRQLTEAFPWDTAPRYLLRDRDASYGLAFRNRAQAMGIEEIVTAPRSPWQNPYASASSARSAANVWITSSSSTSVTCSASCRAIFNIITGPEHISHSTRIVRSLAAYSLLLQARSSRSRRWAVCIIATNDAPHDLRGPPTDAPASA